MSNTAFTVAPVTGSDIQAFVDGVQAMMDKVYANSASKPVMKISEGGKKYIRVVKLNYADDQHGSAYCFIELATGHILKPAGWKVPAKHSRGNINTPTKGVEYVGAYGPAYLR